MCADFRTSCNELWGLIEIKCMWMLKHSYTNCKGNAFSNRVPRGGLAVEWEALQWQKCWNWHIQLHEPFVPSSPLLGCWTGCAEAPNFAKCCFHPSRKHGKNQVTPLALLGSLRTVNKVSWYLHIYLFPAPFGENWHNAMPCAAQESDFSNSTNFQL